ncbi:V-type proton ATPase subunit D-like [Leguminivora glycinivorella]|uniref:V-type proton ATPase subunit D-like n=1 Tax=Leguminivora glycinivorella TaxID=1035111 RepID=UPI00200FA881|nr:V-type proton ATPase subunit D-like [Leguminivora glycinivorella]
MADKDEDDNAETAGKTRFPVLPSLISLQQMRNRLLTAQSGRRLMQWSALATGAELRKIAKELAVQYAAFSEQVADAFIVLARCRYFFPNMNRMVIENFPKIACVTVGRTTKSIAGCRIALFAIEDNCPDSYPLLGIGQGGELVAEAKKTWHELLRKMIYIEQLRSNYRSLEESHDATNKMPIEEFGHTNNLRELI